jgi:lambda family phage tail tape measure protein
MKVDAWFKDLETRSAAIKANLETKAARNRNMASNEPIEISENTKKIKEMLDALDFEYDMLGKIGDERERAIEKAKFLKIIQEEYNGDLQKQAELMADYMEKWDKLAKGKTGPAAFAVKFNEYAENATNFWANLGDVATNALDGMSQSLTDMIMTGKANFRDFARSVLADLLQMMIRSMMVQSIMAGIGYIGSMGNTANATTTAATSGTGSGAMSTGAQHMPGFAKGGAFSGGGVIPFAKGGIFGGMAFGSAFQRMGNRGFLGAGYKYLDEPWMGAGGAASKFASGGVVGRPTVFPMANGNIGLMGEAGPEAIMPLSRGADGKLGVNASGGGGGSVNNVKIVNVMDPNEIRAALSGASGEKLIINAIRRNRGIVRGALG